MHGYAIIKLEADSFAANDSVLQHFNDYMQSRAHSPSFVQGTDGYFRIEYSDSVPATSAGIATFGEFLAGSGYTINSISSGKTLDGGEGTLVLFGKAGHTASVVLSTLNVY